MSIQDVDSDDDSDESMDEREEKLQMSTHNGRGQPLYLDPPPSVHTSPTSVRTSPSTLSRAIPDLAPSAGVGTGAKKEDKNAANGNTARVGLTIPSPNEGINTQHIGLARVFSVRAPHPCSFLIGGARDEESGPPNP